MHDTDEATDYDIRMAIAKTLQRSWAEDMPDVATQAIIINDDDTWHSPATGHSGHWAVDGVNQDDGLPNISILVHASKVPDDCCNVEQDNWLHLDQQVILEEGESANQVAESLLGPRGSATYQVLGILQGDQWPTIRFFGTKAQLAAIAGKASGSAIGRPRKHRQC